jgi:hypothetical protein
VVCEGYVTPAQKKQFVEALSCCKHIEKIAEVGFNGGHTSEIFLENLQEASLISFDINAHPYTKVGVQFMEQTYGERFQMIEGDSRLAIPAYASKNPSVRFDLIYIDGCHLFEACLDDIFHFKQLAHEGTIVWIDDANCPDVQRAIDFAALLRIIEKVQTHVSQDSYGTRSWVEARYTKYQK